MRLDRSKFHTSMMRHFASMGRLHQRRNAGFSLVEVMCAVLILGVSLVGLTRGITTALSSSNESQLQTGAALIAAGIIETLRAEGFVVEGETEGECGESLPPCRWRQSITTSAIDSLYEVAVTIEHAKSGKTIYELRTMLFDPPPPTTRTQQPSNQRQRGQGRRR